MIRLNEIKLPLDHDEEAIAAAIAASLEVPSNEDQEEAMLAEAIAASLRVR